MSTVYTLNGKVLKNAATDKWLTKKEPFVMNASNATLTMSGSTNAYVSWEGPLYPDSYDGNGKHYIIVNNNTAEETAERMPTGLMYAGTATGGGPDAISSSIIRASGTNTGTLSANPVSSYGKYFTLNLAGTEEQMAEYLTNLTISIID